MKVRRSNKIKSAKNTMRITQNNRITTFGRVIGFAALNPVDFPALSKADKLLTIIRAAETDATAGATNQSSSGGETRVGFVFPGWCGSSRG